MFVVAFLINFEDKVMFFCNSSVASRAIKIVILICACREFSIGVFYIVINRACFEILNICTVFNVTYQRVMVDAIDIRALTNRVFAEGVHKRIHKIIFFNRSAVRQ